MTPLTRQLRIGCLGKDVEGAKRTVAKYLGKGRLTELVSKPTVVRRTFGPFFKKDVAKAQGMLELTPSGVYGDATYLALLSAGAVDAKARDLFRQYAEDINPPRPKMCNPIPSNAERYSFCQGLHETAGISGNWAIDLCVADNTPVLACEAGTITRLSGHPPTEDTWDTQGVFGWSIHFRTDTGYSYFVTHLGSRNVTYPGQRVAVGQQLGSVGDQRFRPDHVHYGVTSPKNEYDAQVRIMAVANAPRLPR